ncbi:unnamed protein product [Soboliphyme baturini]|uniref:Serine/arginine-rich splicing factor 10 n=1 Tax=Soboliphyme baturini TaxID=241478 RepID=A0A183IST8_9BILA|nr:unnamed protein product [Soboliphyme baturini]
MAEYARESGDEDRYAAEKDNPRYSDEELRRSSSRSKKRGHHSTSLSKSRSRSRSRSRDHRHRHSRSRSHSRTRSRSNSGEREGVRVHVGEIGEDRVASEARSISYSSFKTVASFSCS